MPEISVQLYSVREQAAADYEGTIRAIAAMGFPCVETAGFPGTTLSKAAALFKELGLTAPSAHCALPVGEDKNRIIEEALELGHRYLITGGPPGWQGAAESKSSWLKAVAQYCEAAENVADHGLQVGYHNHDWDLAEIEGEPAYQLFLKHTPETVLFEADLFWVARAGIDPAEFVKEIGVRGKVLHAKDGIVDQQVLPVGVDTDQGLVEASEDAPFLPAGTGQVDLKAAVGASEHAEIIAVELDAFNGDMMAAVQQSYTYFTRAGMARGNQ